MMEPKTSAWEQLAPTLDSCFSRASGEPALAAQWIPPLTQALGEGCSCLDLTPAQAETLTAAATGNLIGLPGEHKPLVVEHQRLYFQRYWKAEVTIAERLQTLAQRLIEAPPGPIHPPDGLTATQTAAVRHALHHGLTLLCGAPGTGKTRTIAAIVKAIESAPTPGSKPRIGLAAPTGKAAARMAELMERDADASTPKVSTLHRLLGADASGRRFRYGPDRFLPLDVLIVDEVSMIDLTLMARLLEAIDPTQTRLVLVGDSDQLASVEAGAVLGDLTRIAAESTSTLASSYFRLSEVFRSSPGIQSIAESLRSGDRDRLNAQLDGEWSDFRLIEADHPATALDYLLPLIRAGFAPPDPLTADPQTVSPFRILCPTRYGPLGMEAINQFAIERLQEEGVLRRCGAFWAGMPMIITRNDYTLDLFNGDTGWILEGDSGKAEVIIAGAKGPRRLFAEQLTDWEPAYGLTVHRAQGSEFERVALVLSPQQASHLTRELLYTAISRARSRAEIIGSREAVLAGSARQTLRPSGLVARMS